MRHLSLLLAALLHSACTTDDSPLTFEVHTPDRIAGTYVERDVVVRFEIARDGRRHATRLWVDDAAVVAIDVDGDHQRLTLHDGELIVEGPLDSMAPTIEGEILAIRAFETRRQLHAIERTYEQLELAGSDAALLAPSPPAASESRVIAPGETTFLWTTFGRGARTFELVSTAPTCAAVGLGSLPFNYEVVLARGTQSLTRYGWSGLIAVENLGEWTAWDDPVCQSSAVTVQRVR